MSQLLFSINIVVRIFFIIFLGTWLRWIGMILGIGGVLPFRDKGYSRGIMLSACAGRLVLAPLIATAVESLHSVLTRSMCWLFCFPRQRPLRILYYG